MASRRGERGASPPPPHPGTSPTPHRLCGAPHPFGYHRSAVGCGGEEWGHGVMRGVQNGSCGSGEVNGWVAWRGGSAVCGGVPRFGGWIWGHRPPSSCRRRREKAVRHSVGISTRLLGKAAPKWDNKLKARSARTHCTLSTRKQKGRMGSSVEMWGGGGAEPRGGPYGCKNLCGEVAMAAKAEVQSFGSLDLHL